MSTETKKEASAGKKKAASQRKPMPRGKKGGLTGGVVTILFALIKMSGIGITEASGKLGGNVFSRTKGGAVMRNRVVGTNPQTVAQQQVRAIFGAISSAWRSLDSAAREAWNSIANDYPYQNRLGETKILSGKALFQKLNNNLLYAGQSLLVEPNSPEGVNAPVSIESFLVERNIAGTGISIGALDSILATEGDNNTIVVLEMTPSLSPGIKNATPRFVRVAQLTATASGADFDFSTSYVDALGLPSVGSQIQARVFSVNPVTGEKSAYLKADTIVTQEV